MKVKQAQFLLDYLSKNKYATINKLAEVSGVSPSTIRRELNTLEQRGLVKRNHGGAFISDDNNAFPSFYLRSRQNSLEKKKMALSSLKLIKNGDVIFLDGTTSAFFIAEYLTEFENIKVITNGIDTLSLLSKNNVTAYSTGGIVSDVNSSVLVGNHAEKMIENFYADIVFFSAQALTDSGEIYDCFESENVIRKAMIKNAKLKVFLCDSTKFNRFSSYHLCSVNEMDYIVTDKPLPPLNINLKPKVIVTDNFYTNF